MSELRAEMAANVWKLVASEGEAVQAGQPVLVLESMKMEIPVLAETAGTITRLVVNEGTVVQEGDLLAVLAEQ
jgi:biotin carboxyl carrier protein